MKIEELDFRIRIRINMDHPEAKYVSDRINFFITEAFENDVDSGILVDIPEVTKVPHTS